MNMHEWGQAAGWVTKANPGHSEVIIRGAGTGLVALWVLASVFWLMPVWGQGPCTAGIETVAGYVPLGDGGAATAASVMNPRGVAVDAEGNLYIADTDNNRIRKVTTAGVIVTVAGNGLAGAGGDGGQAIFASLNSPSGVAVDAAGNLYIADTGNHRIRKVTPAGIITTVAGTGIGGYSGDGGLRRRRGSVGPLALRWTRRAISTSRILTTTASGR